MARIAALVVEEFDVRVLGEARLDRIVHIEAITSGGNRRRHELDGMPPLRPSGRGASFVQITNPSSAGSPAATPSEKGEDRACPDAPLEEAGRRRDQGGGIKAAQEHAAIHGAEV